MDESLRSPDCPSEPPNVWFMTRIKASEQNCVGLAVSWRNSLCWRLDEWRGSPETWRTRQQTRCRWGGWRVNKSKKKTVFLVKFLLKLNVLVVWSVCWISGFCVRSPLPQIRPMTRRLNPNSALQLLQFWFSFYFLCASQNRAWWHFFIYISEQTQNWEKPAVLQDKDQNNNFDANFMNCYETWKAILKRCWNWLQHVVPLVPLVVWTVRSNSCTY